jgi:hypothetical protein
VQKNAKLGNGENAFLFDAACVRKMFWSRKKEKQKMNSKTPSLSNECGWIRV